MTPFSYPSPSVDSIFPNLFRGTVPSYPVPRFLAFRMVSFVSISHIGPVSPAHIPYITHAATTTLVLSYMYLLNIKSRHTYPNFCNV